MRFASRAVAARARQLTRLGHRDGTPHDYAWNRAAGVGVCRCGRTRHVDAPFSLWEGEHQW